MLANTSFVVTGGTGFIGSHLLSRLHKAGARVTCLIRSSSRTDHLPEGIHFREVNLLTGQGLEHALEGHDVCIHAAALLFSSSWNNYLETNTAAAQHLGRALAALGDKAPQKLILLSSMAATGPSSAEGAVTDQTLPHPVSAYGWSKLLVERTLQSLFRGELIVLRPSIVYGSGDRGLLPVFRGAQHGFCVSPGWGRDFPISCIHGKDMAKAILAAVEHGRPGVYHVSDGKTYTMELFCRAMCAAFGATPHILHLPLPLLTASAGLTTGMYALLQHLLPHVFAKAPNWNLDKAREARQAGWVCDSSRLHHELGCIPDYSLEQGMQESVAGYRKRGWL